MSIPKPQKYNSSKVKKRLRNKADKLFKQIIILRANSRCEVCGSVFGITAHHFFPRSIAGHMVFLIDNGVCLCRGCHFAHHFKSDPIIHQKIIALRGERWYHRLEKIKKEEHLSYKTIAWYRENIKRLESIYEKTLVAS